MPYIPPETRCEIDVEIDALAARIRTYVPFDKRGGTINYTIARLVLNTLKPDGGWSYHSLANALSHVHEAEQEMRRRLLAPYEDECIKKNGDLVELQDFS